LSFDAHGRRRNADWTDAAGDIYAEASRGFTGHEMDDELGLVNMNERLYDPVLGRFMTADTVVEDIAGQGLNHYAYVKNNPLTYVDPTGHRSLRSLLKDVWKHTTPEGLEFGIIKPKYHDPWLVKHPQYIPAVKAINTIVGGIFSVFGGS